MNHVSHRANRGSAYIITLFTVAAIVSMVLIGVRLRLTTNAQSAIIEQMSEGSIGVLDATEYALQKITDDADWNTTAQTGIVYNKFAIGDSAYSSTVLDADTGLTPTESTTTYRVKVAAEHDTVRSAAQIDILCEKVDYLAELNNLGATHYWPLNEKDMPDQALDKLYENHHGTYLIPTVAGAATNDEGASVPLFSDANDYIEVPWYGTFKARNGSISLWMNLTNESKLATTSLLGALYKSGGKASINISIWNFGVSTYICDDGTFSYSNFATSESDAIAPNTWHHIVMTWGSTGLFTYIDGVEAAHNASNTMQLTTERANNGGEQPLHIGGGYLLSPFTHSVKGLDGSLAHVAFFTSQLDAAQVADLAAIKPDLTSTNIVDDSWVRVFE